MPRTVANQRLPRPLVAVAAVAALVAVIPVGYLLVRAFAEGGESFLSLLERPRLPLLIGNSLGLAITVTFSALAIGLPSAFLLSRVRIPLRAFWMVIAALPLAVPSYLAAYGLLAAFPTMQGFAAAWLVLTMVTVPYITLPVASALQSATTDFEDVARTLGRSPFSALLSGSWHNVRTPALAGSLLVFLYVISDFGGVALFRFPVLTTAIYQAYGASYDRNLAAVLSLILITLAIIIVFGERLARGKARTRNVSRLTVGRTRISDLHPRLTPLFAVLSFPAFAVVVIPVTVMLLRMFSAEALASLDPARLWSATVNTLILSLGGALVAVALATPIALLAARYGGRLVGAIESAGYLPLALPGVVVGLSLVFFALGTAPALYQTTFLLALAYGFMFLPKAIGGIRSRVAAIPSSLNDVSRTLGYTPLQSWRSVTGPLSRPGFLLGGLLVMVTAMKELPATLMLRPTGMDTLATLLWSRTDVASYGAAAPYALMLIVLAAIPAFLLSQSDRRGGSPL
ncbi:iron ABC transporter permease [Alpinimonas psychrophila]|uniref:Iron(III) transport system permease protein n=1 Tax=Alpinimonas psychrophila TaxID=748908 RepID=A0A7W3JSJ6_9MICO|nr:iron(III) transport system permease protein [Alpinimonas psychrophila]